MVKKYSYVAVFDMASDGISIEYPDLPGCLSCADTMEEALKNAKEALEVYLWHSDDEEVEVPEPTPIQNIQLEINQVSAVVEAFVLTSCGDDDIACQKLYDNYKSNPDNSNDNISLEDFAKELRIEL